MEELIRKAKEMGIDVEDLILSAMSRLDPQAGVKARLELAEKYMSEAEGYLSKGDVIQSSEKAYKAAGELVKALAEKFDLPEHQQAVREGRWYAYSLASAAARLSQRLGDWVRAGWSSAYVLHVWGFHEGRLNLEAVKVMLGDVKRMLEEAEKVLMA